MIGEGIDFIEQALRTAVGSALAGVPIAEEGVAYNPPENALHCELTYMPASTAASTLGDEGQDENVGLYQIDIVSPISMGTGARRRLVDTLYKAFPLGRGLAYGDQVVTISSFGRSTNRTDGTDNRVAVSLYWRAYTKRSPIT